MARGKMKGNPKIGRTSNQPRARICERRQAVKECQRSRHEANREARQELARLRHEATLDKAAKREPRQKAANRERLTGKGLFYCGSAEARMKEIQRRRACGPS